MGAEYRARLVNEVLAPLLTGKDLSHPSELWSYITARTRVLALQCGSQAASKVLTVQTTTNGAFSAAVQPLMNTTYTVKVRNTTSSATTVSLRPKMRLD